MSVTGSSPTQEQRLSGREELLPTLDVVGGFNPPEKLIDLGLDEPAAMPANPYEAWRMDPSIDNLVAVTKSLKPTIDSVLATMGASGSPDLASKAKVVTAKAVMSYNPAAGASLPTWVSQQLRQLTRAIRKSNDVLSIPDGVKTEAFKLHNAELEFEDEHGREPTVLELADKTGLSVKRIASIRKKMRPVANESAYTQEGNNGIVGAEPDYLEDAKDYVYHDSDLIDRRIMEYTLGYGGHEILDNKAIMQKLKLNPVKLSRRGARLAMRIRDIIKDLRAL